MKKKATLLRAMMLIMTLLSIVSCGRQKPRYVIGVSQCSNDVWRTKMNEELKIAAFAYNGVDLRIASAQDNADLQVKQIRQYIDEKVDLLIVAPEQAKVDDAIRQAYEAGIPVIVFDRRTSHNAYTAYIGADNMEMGRNMATYLLSHSTQPKRILEITGRPSSSPAIERQRGFDSEIDKQRNSSVVERIACDWTEERAYQLVDSLLRVPHRDFNCVFAHNDRMAMGAKKAMKKHHANTTAICFVGIDAIPSKGGGMQMVRDGELTASYIYPTRGDEVMKLAIDILERRKYERENLLSSALVTKDNANVLLMQNEELKRQTDKLISLRQRVEATTTAFDTQRNYLFALLLLLGLLIVACALAVKAYVAKSRYSQRLNESIDEQRRMTAEMSKMTQSQLRFFTNISHELRTPLTLISGPADQLRESRSMSDGDRQLIDMIRRNAGILKQMVNEILEFRKVQNDKAQLKLNKFDVAQELQKWAADFKAVAERKEIAMEVNTPGAAITQIVADKEKLAHIYFNLMSNALKYTPQGGKITTTLTHADGKITLAVADTGRGMADDDRKHIFERFYQATESVGGTGIGLALVKAYADLHHGTSRVESIVGKGSTFIIELPDTQPGYDASKDHDDEVHISHELMDDYTAKDLNKEHNISEIAGTEDYDTNRPLILVVDDNASMRNYLRSILQQDFNVVEAQNGEEGLTLAQRLVPQLVVSDVMMPVMNGLQLCGHLKENMLTCHIPIILLTARSLEEQRSEGYATGADSYITKPFAAPTLTTRINNLLRNRTMLKQLFSGSMRESEEENTLDTHDRDFVVQLRKAINQHIPDANYSVEDLGAEIGLSRVQLYRKVKALTGLSVVDLLRKARLAKAKQLLETSDMNISEIAYSVGFATPSYFAKRFKEEYGKSPGEMGGNRP